MDERQSKESAFPVRVECRIAPKDEIRLKLMCSTLSLSKSSVIRAALVALSRQLGFERDFHSDFLREK